MPQDHRQLLFDVYIRDVIWEKRRKGELMAAFIVSGFLQYSFMLE